jgi:hypothetical protein
MSKNHLDAATLDIPIQRAIFEQKVCPFRVFDIASASTGSLRAAIGCRTEAYRFWWGGTAR